MEEGPAGALRVQSGSEEGVHKGEKSEDQEVGEKLASVVMK